MAHYQYKNISESILKPTEEKTFAVWRQSLGKHVVFHNVAYWEGVRRVFYQSIHLIARLRVDRVKPPVVLCWGYLAALKDNDSNSANGSIIIHTMPEVNRAAMANYDS